MVQIELAILSICLNILLLKSVFNLLDLLRLHLPQSPHYAVKSTHTDSNAHHYQRSKNTNNDCFILHMIVPSCRFVSIKASLAVSGVQSLFRVDIPVLFIALPKIVFAVGTFPIVVLLVVGGLWIVLRVKVSRVVDLLLCIEVFVVKLYFLCPL